MMTPSTIAADLASAEYFDLTAKIKEANAQIGSIRRQLRKPAFQRLLDGATGGKSTRKRLTEIARATKRRRATITSTVDDLDLLERTLAYQRRLCSDLTSAWARMPMQQRQTLRRFLHNDRRQWDRSSAKSFPNAYRHQQASVWRLDINISSGLSMRARLDQKRARDAAQREADAELERQQLAARRRDIFRRCLRMYSNGTRFAVALSETFSEIQAEASIDYGWEKVGSRYFWQCQGAHYELILADGWDEYPDWLKACDNLLTLGALRAGAFEASEAEEVYRAKWVVRRQGGVSVSEGYIVRQQQDDGSWQTAHAKTVSAGRGVLSRRRTYSPEIACGKRAKRIEAILQALHDGQHAEVLVTLADSRRAGNCASGTRQWVEDHFPDQDSATVREILMADSGNNARHVLNACVAAVLRANRGTRR